MTTQRRSSTARRESFPASTSEWVDGADKDTVLNLEISSGITTCQTSENFMVKHSKLTVN